MKSTSFKSISLVTPVLVPDEDALAFFGRPPLVPVTLFYIDKAPDNHLTEVYKAEEINFIPKDEVKDNYDDSYLNQDTIQVILPNKYELAIPTTQISSVLYKEI